MLPITYRTYFETHAKFINVVSIQDDRILQLTHFNYRLLFFRESIAATWLEENGLILIMKVHCFYHTL